MDLSLPPHVFLPVIQVRDRRQALKDVHTAMEYGAHGVFLGSDYLSPIQLVSAFRYLQRECRGVWIGLSLRGLGPIQAIMTLPQHAQGILLDSTSERIQQVVQQKKIDWNGKVFTKPFDQSLNSLQQYVSFTDVVVVEAPALLSMILQGTIHAWRQLFAEKPLAVFGDITPQSIDVFLPHATHFLVTDGVQDALGDLSPERLSLIAEKVRSLDHAS